MTQGHVADPDTLTSRWAGGPRKRFAQPPLEQRIKQETAPIKVYRLTPEEIAERYPDQTQPGESKLDRLKQWGGR